MENHLLVLPPTRPESTEYTRQPTARSARRIARHAEIAAAQASVDLAAAVGAWADLTSTVQAPADLTSAVHAPAGRTIAVPTTACCPIGMLPSGKARNALAPGFCPHQTRPATPLHPTAPLRSATPSPRVPPLASVARKAISNEGSSNPLARQRAAAWLDAPWLQVEPGLNDLLPDESGWFSRHP